MPGRVLNFLEFSDKYSNGSTEPASVDDIKSAAANFEEGFDQETYDQPQIGPNRPVAGNYEATPATPGEEGAPAFSADNTADMNAPQENEESPEEEEDEDSDEESEEDETEEDEVEEGNPEAGSNPKKKVDEGITLVKGFAQFINEEHGDYPKYFMDDESDEDHYGSDEKEDEDCCEECGEVPISNEYGYSCGCNM
jgi:type IV secretory pathway VirB10-like protein